MKKFFKTPGKTGKTSPRFTLLLLLLLMAWGSVATYAQTIGIIQGLTPVTPRAGQPSPVNGWPTVELPVVMGGPGEIYVNRFYKFNTNGQLEDFAAGGVSYDPVNFTGWVGYCVQCTVGDIPPLYRAITLNCNPGSVGPWKPDPYSDPAMAVATNNCTASQAWSNPLTWDAYKVPTQATGAFYINRNVTLDVSYDATNKAIYGNSNSATITINSGVTLTGGGGPAFINNGIMNGLVQTGTVVNNGVLEPGGNGVIHFGVIGGHFLQNAGGSLTYNWHQPVLLISCIVTSTMSIILLEVP